MSFSITQAMVEQYSSNCRMLAEQERAILRPICEVKGVVGKSFYGERLGGTEAQTITERHGTNPNNEIPHSRRKGTVIDKDAGAYIDENDEPKCIVDFKGKYPVKLISALNRAEDDVIIEALGGAVYQGEAGGTTIQNYDVGECRIVNGDGTIVTSGSDASDTTETALTIAKLADCGQMLDEAPFPEEMGRYFITNAYNKWQLLQTTEVKDIDYNTVKALAYGKIDTFMGFKFLWTERLKTHATDTGCVRSYACVQGAIALGVGQENLGRMWQDSGRRNSWYCYAWSSKGATRQEGPAVIEVLLKKSR